MFQTQFTSDERDTICQTLGDSPFTIIPSYMIRQPSVNIILNGTPTDIKGLVIQSHELMEEPTAFGTSVQMIMDCLQQINGWTCVNVALELADELAEILQKTIQCPIRQYDDVYYVLDHLIDLQELSVDKVTFRFLTVSDDVLLENAPSNLLSADLGDYVVGAIVDNRMVAISHASAISEQYADVGVHTDEAWRKMGISTHLSRMVMHRLQSKDYTPVWSTGESNHASQRVADKLGMKFYGNRKYLILEEKN
jgi:hypothetical protein